MAGLSGPEVLPPGLSIIRDRVRGACRGVSIPDRKGTPRFGCHKASTENVPDATKKMAERVGFELTESTITFRIFLIFN